MITEMNRGDQVNRSISPLSELQIRILTLLGLPQGIYLALAAESSLPF